jgi:1-deoxy-D-xylulose-5-phosphate reductoisomerase
MAKKVAILGSTGSIGKSAINVIEALGEGYEVYALTANLSGKQLAAQCKSLGPKYAALTDSEAAEEFDGVFKDLLGGNGGEFLFGPGAMETIASLDEVDIVITAVVGAAGLPAVLAAAKKGKTIAIANKEPLVMAGRLVTETARQGGAVILPVDSEHSAIFQCLGCGRREDIRRIILTASGGPFRGKAKEDFAEATVEEVLDHPTWDMGPKITVDSATMMNKALEVIEAVWLFDVPAEKVEVLVHPESIIHSMVEFLDGSVIAQLGATDMCLPIQYALTYPARVEGVTKHLQLDELGRLTFEKPDIKAFKALELGFEVARRGDSAPAVFNASNEAAVEEFLQGNIKFSMIVELIEQCLDKHNVIERPGLEELMKVDGWAREEVKKYIKKQSGQKVG